jgi:hypothetical protein
VRKFAVREFAVRAFAVRAFAVRAFAVRAWMFAACSACTEGRLRGTRRVAHAVHAWRGACGARAEWRGVLTALEPYFASNCQCI